MRPIRWLVGVVAVLALMVAAMWAIGSLLPVEHRATVSRALPADADSVWRRIDDIERWPSWREASVDVLAADAVRVRENGETIRYRIERPGERTLVTEIDTPGLPFGGRWIWSVAAAADDTAVVTIVEEGEVYDPFFRFFSRFVFGHESSIRSVLDQLEASLD